MPRGRPPVERNDGPTEEMKERQATAHGVRAPDGTLSWGLDPLTVLWGRKIITQDEMEAGRDLQKCYIAKFGSPFSTGSSTDRIGGKAQDNEHLQLKFARYERVMRDFGPDATSLMREIVIFEQPERHIAMFGFVIDGRVKRTNYDDGDFSFDVSHTDTCSAERVSHWFTLLVNVLRELKDLPIEDRGSTQVSQAQNNAMVGKVYKFERVK